MLFALTQRVKGLGFLLYPKRPGFRVRASGLELSTLGLGFRVWGLRFRVGGLGFTVWGLRFEVSGLGFRV